MSESDTVIRDILKESKCKFACCCHVCSPCYCPEDKVKKLFGCVGTNQCLFCRGENSCQNCFCGLQTMKQRCLVGTDDQCFGPGWCGCCGCASQCCCSVNAYQFPPGDEVPFAIGCFDMFCIGGQHFEK